MNQKGQALIEAMLFGAFSVIGVWLLLKCGGRIIYTHCLEEFAEEFLLCEGSGNSDCRDQLERHLRQSGLPPKQITFFVKNGKSNLYVQIHSDLFGPLQTLRELSLELSRQLSLQP